MPPEIWQQIDEIWNAEQDRTSHEWNQVDQRASARVHSSGVSDALNYQVRLGKTYLDILDEKAVRIVGRIRDILDTYGELPSEPEKERLRGRFSEMLAADLAYADQHMSVGVRGLRLIEAALPSKVENDHRRKARLHEFVLVLEKKRHSESTKDAPESDPSHRKVYLTVGCVFAVAALAMAFWAFGIGNLTDDQRQLLKWLLPIASGVAAGAFTGVFTLNSKLLFPATVGATGGFAVWLAAGYFLFSEPKPADFATTIYLKDEAGRLIEANGEIVLELGNLQRWDVARGQALPRGIPANWNGKNIRITGKVDGFEQVDSGKLFKLSPNAIFNIVLRSAPTRTENEKNKAGMSGAALSSPTEIWAPTDNQLNTIRDARRPRLVVQFFSSDADERSQAQNAVEQTWRSDRQLLRELLAEGPSHFDNPESIKGLCRVIAGTPMQPIVENYKEIEAFVAKIPATTEYREIRKDALAHLAKVADSIPPR